MLKTTKSRDVVNTLLCGVFYLAFGAESDTRILCSRPSKKKLESSKDFPHGKVHGKVEGNPTSKLVIAFGGKTTASITVYVELNVYKS